MEFNSKRIPLEVTEIILSNLGVSDLLNCRLVDQDWNRECLKQLRKSKERISVNIDNISSVLEFVTKSAHSETAQAWVFPFELRMPSSQDKDAEGPPTTTVLEKYCHQISSLIDLAPGSIFDFNFIHYFPIQEHTFRSWVQILSKCSAHLEQILIWLEGSTTSASMSLAVNILRDANLKFPRLKILKIIDTIHGPFIKEETVAHVFIQKCPDLEELRIIFCSVYFDQSNWPLPPLPNLKKLTCIPDQHDSSDLSQTIPPVHLMPNLEHLYFFLHPQQSEQEPQTQAIRTTLLSFSRTLKFLTIQSLPATLDLDGDSATATVHSIKFPFLPTLEHLRFSFPYISHVAGIHTFANPEEFNFSQANFPALKSVDIELGFHWGLPTLPIQTFSSVERLRLRTNYSRNYSQLDLQKYLAHIQSVFPNVNNFSLDNDCPETLRPVLEAVFGSLRAHQIHTFELIEKDRDSVSDGSENSSCRRRRNGRLTGGYFVLPINNMTNVTKFRTVIVSKNIKEDDLRWFTQQFPSLAQIEIILPSERCERPKQEHIKKVLKKFKNYVVRVDYFGG